MIIEQAINKVLEKHGHMQATNVIRDDDASPMHRILISLAYQ